MNIFTSLFSQKHLIKLILVFSIVAFAFEGVWAQTYTFTNAGATGQFGPTQADINTAYSGTNLAGQVTSNGGIQQWVVPQSGLYKIEVYGAQGFGPFGGRGAYMSGEFLLTAGQTLKILVGQKGAPPVGSGTNQYGGGGGSFVTTSTNSPIIIAGGGGGSWASSFNSTTDASITTSGNTGANGPTNGAGGTNGQGGAAASSAGGGGGLLTDGGDVSGGKAFVNGGAGGIATTNGGEGGFGGGGGASSWDNRRGGGGGGYSGGGGAGSTTSGFPEGGGGGSFNSGNNQVNTAGVQLGHGMIVITVLSSGASNDVGVIGIPQPNIFCAGSQAVVASVQNFGVNKVTSFTVNWSVNGTMQTPYVFSGNLDTIGGSGSAVVQVPLGNYTFTNTPVTVKAWTSMPNSSVDTVNVNDTLSVLKQPSLPAPTGLTALNVQGNQATITWTGGANNTWLYRYNLAGATPTGNGTVATNDTVTITGLQGERTYDFYVREVCAGGDTSVWAGPLTFTTPFYCPPGSFCFRTCGNNGRTGPTQTQCNTTYAGTPLAGVTVNNGIQVWNVPSTGLYTIEAFGAQGGGSDTRPGGKGAHIKGDFVLIGGNTLNVLVGQSGLISTGSTPAGNRGGGGGTFIWNPSDTTKPIIAAGGGGGTNVSTSSLLGVPGTISTAGTFKADNTGNPGANGNGAAPGGAGFFTGSTGDDNGTPAQAILQGGEGGVGYTASSHFGGFGGGGGGGGSPSTTFASGGGGGYSGGAGQGTPASVGGGGGGSYNEGINQTNLAGVKSNNGVIIITPIAGTYLDAQLMDVSPATGEVCRITGTVPVKAFVRSYSTAAINNITVTAQLSGANTGTFTQTIPTMPLGDRDTITLTTIDNNIVGETTVKVFVSYANDNNRTNDTLTYTYTVNPIPAVPTASDVVVCNDQTADLIANSANANIHWYNVATGGTEVAIGDTFTTPVLQNSITYYAEAEAKGCISPTRKAINIHVSQLALDAGQSDTICHDQTITLGGNPSAVGSDGPFTYQWSPGLGLSSTTIANPVLTPDTTTLYTMTVTDSKGCVKSTAVGIMVSEELIVTEQIAEPCPGETNGEINLGLTGGIMPLSYNWNTGSKFPFIWGAAAGSYSVTISDLIGCTITKTFNISVADSIKAQAQITNMNSNLTPNGAINLTVSGGNGTYTYNWSNGATSQNISGLSAGNYTVTINDGHCERTFTFAVANAVGIEDSEYFTNLNIYPNPAGNKFTVDISTKVSTTVSIEVFDLLGRRVYAVNDLNSSSINHEINSSEWSQGTFMVKVSAEGFSTYRKIEIIK